MKPTLIQPITASTRASTGCGSDFENTATAAVHSARISTHSSSEPSCAPQTAGIWYSAGSRLLELVATYATEKSCTTNACVSTA